MARPLLPSCWSMSGRANRWATAWKLAGSPVYQRLRKPSARGSATGVQENRHGIASTSAESIYYPDNIMARLVLRRLHRKHAEEGGGQVRTICRLARAMGVAPKFMSTPILQAPEPLPTLSFRLDLAIHRR